MKPVLLVTVALAACTLIGAIAFSENKNPAIVECTELRIRDSDGKNRIRIATTSEVAFISIYSSKGERVCTLGHRTTDGNVTLEMGDTDDKPRVLLSARGDGASELNLLDRNGSEARLRVDPKEASGLSIYAPTKRLVAGVLSLHDGTRLVRLADAQGQPRVSLGVRPNGEPGLRLTGDDGKVRNIGPGE